jgi:hypothetical protein
MYGENSMMTTNHKIFECFSLAKKEEEKGKKHKGLLFVGCDDTKAEKKFEVPKELL